jgi:lipoprotein-anchoring transpeptidase ErfK/SrfK
MTDATKPAACIAEMWLQEVHPSPVQPETDVMKGQVKMRTMNPDPMRILQRLATLFGAESVRSRRRYGNAEHDAETGQTRMHLPLAVARALGVCLLLAAFAGSPAAAHATYGHRSTAADAGGGQSIGSRNFASAAKPNGDPITTTIDLPGGTAYGVGMPIPVKFSAPIPAGSRNDVERRLSVKSDPPQTGAWRWYGDQQIIYRPKDYWRPGSKLTVNAALGGLAVGGSRFDADRNATATIGKKTTLQITNSTKQMQVFQNDKLVKTYPVSLGAPETPTSSGNMLIMSREPRALWTYGPNETLDIRHAERLTGDGEYIHGAPWSVADQGERNVSHGCTNLAPENAEWVFNNTQVGDPVTVSGTEKRLDPGNGWTVWDLSWADYIKKS